MTRAYRAFLCVMILSGWAVAPSGSAVFAQRRMESGSLSITPETLTEALEPTLRKWYVPQELYYQYRWEPWEYSNYAKESYKRYVDIELEGRRYYDLYGSHITRGWRIFDWTQEEPRHYGSEIWKSPKYDRWFDRVLVSQTSKGQYHTSVTFGDEIRATLTPLTFSKPAFSGIQWDFLSDKYALTALFSRISNPAVAASSEFATGPKVTSYTNLIGLRGTLQLGDFGTLGATFVDGYIGNAANEFTDNSLKGVLSSAQNAGNVREITLRISDDSPEDGEAGGALYKERIMLRTLDGRVESDIHPVRQGGIRVAGHWEANGDEVITLRYDIPDPTMVREIEFELVLANDYDVEVTSNLQTNGAGEQVYLPVIRAPGNVNDGSNQRIVRFAYGLPTGNQIYGATLEVMDVLGFSLVGEYDVNRRFRRFPNRNIRVNQSLASDRAEAYYVTLSKRAYPWFGYGELFSMDGEYSTTMFMTGPAGDVDYENAFNYWYEYVDDNDDQDRYPDWKRLYQPRTDGEVFPGWDEDNDFVSDFNQNDNYFPDYDEPFLRYRADPPEFLFGMDMNNNTVIDRFENDDQPDYLYKRDRRGYNGYVGANLVPEIKVTLGRFQERQLSSHRRSWANYALLTVEKSYPGLGRLRLFDFVKMVKDDIPDDVFLWVQRPMSRGAIEQFSDPLWAQNTLINSAFFAFDYTALRGLKVINKVKCETYRPRRRLPDGTKDDITFLGMINKADYTLRIGDLIVLPKVKSMYVREKHTEREKGGRNEISGILFLMLRYPLTKGMELQIGFEGTRFVNWMDRAEWVGPKVFAARYIGEYVGDYWGQVYALQFSNRTEYLGYQLATNMGFRFERKGFEAGKETTSTTVFARVYAGAQD